MEFRKVLILRGPNIWAQFPVLEAWVDLHDLQDARPDAIPGFMDRLTAWLPALAEHRCVSRRGTPPEPLGPDTDLAHALGHVALELQGLAGVEVRFSRSRPTATPGLFRVVVEYEEEEPGLASLEAARRLCLAAVHDRPCAPAEEVAALRALAGHAGLGPGPRAIVRAAQARGIPVRRLSGAALVQLGHGARQRRIRAAETDRTGALAGTIASDPELTRTLLRAVGVPVPEGRPVADAADAWEAAGEIGAPVVVRPRAGDPGLVPFTGLSDRALIESAFHDAARGGQGVLVERFAPGASHRLLVVAGVVVAAARGEGQQGDRIVDVTDAVDPEVAARAVEAARVVGLDVAGIVVVAQDIGRPLEEQGGVVVGVCASPGLRIHLEPSVGRGRPVGEAIVGSLFPEGQDGRIPIAAVTGVNGKTTVTRLIAHLLTASGRAVGMTCSDGMYVAGRRIQAADCSGPRSAWGILLNPKVEVAVLETARGGILRAGLGFDGCDVAVVTNIGAGDHLGLSGVETLEELAQVKGTLVRAVRPGGTAVLKADDPLTAAMAPLGPGRVIFFARDGGHPILADHRARGGRAVFVRLEAIVRADGPREEVLAPLTLVPMTLGGRVGFQVENALAAVAAAWALDLSPETTRAGLASFETDMETVPGRFNWLEIDGATVVADFGHNPSALEALVEALGTGPHRRRRVVLSADGDRRDDVIIRQAEILAGAFDEVILYEEPSRLRGRRDGEITALLRRGLAAAAPGPTVTEIAGELPAIEAALGDLHAGDLVLILLDAVDASLAFIRGFLADRRGGRAS